MADIEKLLSDPDFMALPEDEQNAMIDEMRNVDFGRPPRSENVLQRAAKSFNRDMAIGGPGMVLYNAAMAGKNTLLEPAIQAHKQSMQSIGMPNSITDSGDWIIKNIATDPLNYSAAKGAVNLAGSGARGLAGFVKNVKNPSAVFGSKMASAEAASPNTRVDFLKVVSDAMDDPMARKVIEKSGAMAKYGGTTLGEGGSVSENLANLSLKDSQEFVNLVKSGVRQAVKEGVVKPTEIGIAKLFSGLSESQNAAFPTMKAAKSSYGMAKNVGKYVDKSIKKAATWGPIAAVGGAAGTVGHKVIKSFFGHR